MYSAPDDNTEKKKGKNSIQESTIQAHTARKPQSSRENENESVEVRDYRIANDEGLGRRGNKQKLLTREV